jgi:hypothetical protein
MSERHGKRGLHKDWRTWVVVAVMLGAIGMYVASLDDTVVPDESAPSAPAP